MNTYFANFDHRGYRYNSSVIYFRDSATIGIVAWMLAGIFISVLIVACTVEYSKMTTVPGRTVSDKGIVKIYSNAGGIVTRIHVKEGHRIENGEKLFVVKPHAETPVELGVRSAPASLIENLKEKKRVSDLIANASNESLGKTILILEGKRRDLLGQMALINDEYAEHGTLVQRANININRHRTLIEEEFLSKAALSTLEDDLTAQKKSGYALMRQRKDLEMQLQGVNGQIEEYKIKKTVLDNQHKQEVLGIEADAIGVRLRDELVVRAPSSGVIHNIATSEGDSVQHKPLAMLIPEDSIIMGEALIPSRNIGFIRMGQEVRVRYLAYPYQKYGTFKGVVASIGSVPVHDNAETGEVGDMHFKVQFRMESQALNISGRNVGLMPGMSFNADIKTDTRLIAEWILDPIMSLKRYF